MTTLNTRRGVVGVLLFVCLGVLAVAFHHAEPVRPPPEAQRTPATENPRQAVSPTPTVSPPGTAPTPNRTPVGIDLVATPRTDATFDVVETVQLRQPTDRLVLAPPSAPPAPVAVAAFRPRADFVELRADGREVAIVPAEVTAYRVVVLSSPASRIELRYRLTGAMIRSTPSIPGRALGIAAPLTAEQDGSLPATLTFARARNVLCPLLERTRLLCATIRPGGMSSPPGLVAEDATVVLQLDLPPAP